MGSNNKAERKKLRTLFDLYNFCANRNENIIFNSVESGYKLAVQVPAQFEVNAEQNDTSLLFCLVKLMHSGENRNHSSVTDDALIKASKTLAYKPILANFVEYIDPETNEKCIDFTSHDMEITEEGITYYERQVGCFTADEPYFEIEKETEHNFLYGYCAIPRDYTEAASIIERKNGTKVSVELEINEMQYSAKNKVLELTDINILGATCLGKDPDTLENVEEGMKNARLDILDFSQENNSMMNYSVDNEYMNKLIEILDTLNNTLSKFNINTEKSVKIYGKEEDESMNEEIRIEEVTEEEVVEAVDIIDETTEIIEEATEEVEVTEMEEFTEEVTEAETDESVENDTPEVGEETTEEIVFNEIIEENFENLESEGLIIRTYAISHDDIRYGLYTLLAIQEEADNDWYFINAVYDDYFTYENWSGDKIYGQSYTKEDDAVAFEGNRWNLHRELLTDSEYAQLVEMRSNYASLVQFKLDTENTKLHAQRESILYDEKYSVLSEKDEKGNYKNEAYAKLVSDMDNYSLADLEKELKAVFADHITNGGQFTYSNVETKTIVNKKQFATSTGKKTSRYGNLFNK